MRLKPIVSYTHILIAILILAGITACGREKHESGPANASNPPEKQTRLADKIRDALKDNIFLKPQGLEVVVIDEKDGFVKLSVTKGSRRLRAFLAAGTDLDSGLGAAEMSGSDGQQGWTALKKTVDYIKTINGVKAVFVTAEINTKAEQAEDLYQEGVEFWRSKDYGKAADRMRKAAEMGCSTMQEGNNFGRQFGRWQLRGVEGIKEDLWCSSGKDRAKFNTAWAEYPNHNYPPPMGANAIFFNDADPGCFLVYFPQVRPDVYLIIQSLLADNTFMTVTRDLYGNQLWIPALTDSNRAFQEFIQGVQSGKIDAGADLKIEDGRVQVTGVGGVMQINGILCKQIFDNNQYLPEPDKKTRQSASVGQAGKLRNRDFYVEESYVIPWMYPYMTPHGLIMKLNNEPTQITPEMVKNDHEFWGWCVNRLVNDASFTQDVAARQTSSKLRSAIAGLYAARGNQPEAEYAFKQAVELYPLGPEAVFRLADLYMRQKRFDDAHKVVSNFVAQDVHNDSARGFLKKIEQSQQMIARKTELEGRLRSGQTADINAIYELLQLYNALQEQGPMTQLLSDVLRSNLPSENYLQLAQMLVQMQCFDHAIQTLKTAVEKGGEPTRAALRKDSRFQALYNDARFQALFPPMPAKKGVQ